MSTHLQTLMRHAKLANMALADPIKNPLRVIRKQPPSLFRRLAHWWAAIGSLLVVFAGAMAVAHYRYGVPIYDKDTGRVIDPDKAAAIFLALGLGGTFFAVTGILILRAMRRKSLKGS